MLCFETNKPDDDDVSGYDSVLCYGVQRGCPTRMNIKIAILDVES